MASVTCQSTRLASPLLIFSVKSRVDQLAVLCPRPQARWTRPHSTVQQVVAESGQKESSPLMTNDNTPAPDPNPDRDDSKLGVIGDEVGQAP